MTKNTTELRQQIIYMSLAGLIATVSEQSQLISYNLSVCILSKYL